MSFKKWATKQCFMVGETDGLIVVQEEGNVQEWLALRCDSCQDSRIPLARLWHSFFNKSSVLRWH